MESQQSLESLARELAALPPSLGPVRLIGIDGHAGSGKSTFAERLAGALGGAPVLHLDDVATHEEPFGWTARLRTQVLEPLAAGRAAHWAPYDWVERRFGPHRVLEPAPVLLVEGVGAGRRALRPRLARLLWMETPRERSWGRGRNRDGQELSDFWDGWERAELAHFSDDPSRPFADTLVHQSGTGYEWTSGVSATPRTAPSVTERNGLPQA
ncbi:uridine kinase [Streptomyces sp. NPDC090077]|uniref:uridine kinase family protein n=1 Tax=Streptomyces sp. NPDC090077 TaxID=3365938 RepID=UPI003826B0DE